MHGAKVTILQGLPGSGKSTWARKEAKKHPRTTVIVNRDAIRSGLGEYWVPTREDLVTDIEDHMIYAALMRGFDVILDATNFNPKTLEKVQRIVDDVNREKLSINAAISILRFDVPLQTAIWRDFWRGFWGERKVGKKVIKGFYERYIETDVDRKLKSMGHK